MREWIFAHNIYDGFPHEAVILIQRLGAADSSVAAILMGPQSLERKLLALPEDVLDTLLMLPTHPPDLNAAHLQKLLKGLKRAVPPSTPDLTPVNAEKIASNRFDEASERSIRDNTQYAAQVAQFVQGDPDPTFGDKVAASLRKHYLLLRSQGLESSAILDGMIGYIVGDRHDVAFADVKAAEAIVAYFFSTCDLFENAQLG
jgi:hypothetical protein